MYELFMTAVINDVDFDRARSVLSGYSWDEPHKRLYRVLFFNSADATSPKPITKLTNIHGLPPPPDPFAAGLPGWEPPPDPNAPYFDPEWKALSDILKR